ncbi:MAG: DUF4126 domain-containing protein [Gemmatimonadaceae bacterium]|nr:DUF4126 domain-containing protein [Gemmatimonadaceae bacterium]
METFLSVLTGIGVAAACGFRVFVPLLALGLAGRAGVIPLNDSFVMLSTLPALVALGTAAVLEVVAYYVPWLDNALDVAAAPAAVVAGVLASAAAITDLPPVLAWGIALIGGGGAAGLLHGATSLLRLKSTAVTGGAANPVVSTGELVGSIVTAALALLVPVVCAIGLVLVLGWMVRQRMSKPHTRKAVT